MSIKTKKQDRKMIASYVAANYSDLYKMAQDSTDGYHRSRSVHARFTLPLSCCFGVGSKIDAELTIKSKEEDVDSTAAEDLKKTLNAPSDNEKEPSTKTEADFGNSAVPNEGQSAGTTEH